MTRECRSKGIRYLFRGFVVVVALSRFAVEVCHKTTSMTDDFSILIQDILIAIKDIILYCQKCRQKLRITVIIEFIGQSIKHFPSCRFIRIVNPLFRCQ